MTLTSHNLISNYIVTVYVFWLYSNILVSVNKLTKKFSFFYLLYSNIYVIVLSETILHFTTLSGHDSVSERPVSGAYRLPSKPIIPRCSWHEPPSHMMAWQSGNQRRKRFARGRSLSCATHVKSLSRHKWFADCCRPLENGIWPFGRIKPAVWSRNMQIMQVAGKVDF